ncbi:MAG: archaeosortase/exosortase family protein, partial [Telluria sp.]
MAAQAPTRPAADAALPSAHEPAQSRAQLRTRLRAAMPEWWPVLAGLVVLFAPTFHNLFTGAWIGEEQGHGPIIFALTLGLIWRKWPAVLALPAQPSSLGWPLLAVGLALHLLGRSQSILMFEVSSIL